MGPGKNLIRPSETLQVQFSSDQQRPSPPNSHDSTDATNRVSIDPFACLPSEFTIGPVDPAINQPNSHTDSVMIMRHNHSSSETGTLNSSAVNSESPRRSGVTFSKDTEANKTAHPSSRGMRRTMGFAAETTNKGRGNTRDQAIIGTLGRSKKLTHPERQTDIVNILAPEPENKYGPWSIFVFLVTCCFPSVLLSRLGGMHDKAVQRAWREKVALCWVALLMCILLAFITFGLQTVTCKRDMGAVSLQTFKKYSPSTYPQRFSIHGTVYSMTPYIKTHNAFGALANSSTAAAIDKSTGVDISALFPPTISAGCAAMIKSAVTPSCKVSNFEASHCHTSPNSINALSDLRVGHLTFDWPDLVSDPSRRLLVFRSLVIDVTPFLNQTTSIFGTFSDDLMYSYIGRDATRAFFDANSLSTIECAASISTIGSLSSESTGCLAADTILYISLIVIGALIIIRFVLAMLFSWFISRHLGKLQKQDKNDKDRRLSRRVQLEGGIMPFTMQVNGNLAIAHRSGVPTISPMERRETLRRRNVGTKTVQKPSSNYGRELHTIMLVTCYSEDEQGLRTTFNSLAMTDYSEDHKVLFIIADGMIKGSGNTQTTPELILSMLELDPNWEDPEGLSYLAIGEGSKEHNRAKVYVGWYSYQDRVVPTILIVKCGTEEESKLPKPGNRGKRDSQMILMRFLQKVTLDESMTPLEYDLFLKLHYLMGVTPDTFEIVLMVDADTKVAPDSVARMVACMASDPLVMGLCGETRIANKSESWVSRIQVFEYYLSHHLNKAFESMFGGVTCLPGCFCMYRIKAPKDGYWVPILCNPDIVQTYSESVVDTLHKKNLLLLGEDRFLTTLMLRAFPRRKLLFVPRAFCKTTVPNTFAVLLSQRRRWINSTIHNLLELVLVSNLCGIFCFSMQFVIFLELIGTITLPAAILFTLTLIIVAIIGPVVPVIPLILLAGILGLPAILILLTTRRVVYIYWMFVYLLALPIWNFVLPVYAFWHFDDFSWGQTRLVEGEGKGGHGGSDGKAFSASDIPTRRWVEWERDRRQGLVQRYWITQ
ncbi:hypothetical protein O5D80_003928 [Batrachochytrium dendrobatidis]|nr:hypothetical protein O5D80_003928 [Batrachochytrium dendrobatidis]